MHDLEDKISKVKDAHAAEVVEQRSAEFDERARTEAVFFLGRVKQNEHIADAVSGNLKAQTIIAMERFQEEKKYKSLGFETFDQFLDSSDLSPMKKRAYYERRALIKAHGPDIFDLLTSVGISVRSQKLLGKGELSIQGDQLMIGDKAVDVANTGVIKDVLAELFDERRELMAASEKQSEKIEKLEAQVDRGEQDLEQLQRNLDAMKNGDPYQEAFAQAVYALGDLSFRIGQLPDARKAEYGPDALETLWAVMQQVRKSYNVKFAFHDAAPASAPTSLDEIAAAVLNDDGEEDNS